MSQELENIQATPAGVIDVLRAEHPEVFNYCLAKAAAVETGRENALLRSRIVELEAALEGIN